MRRPHIKLSERPKKFCSICRREVYQTIHTVEAYWADWYGTLDKVICVDCHKK